MGRALWQRDEKRTSTVRWRLRSGHGEGAGKGGLTERGGRRRLAARRTGGEAGPGDGRSGRRAGELGGVTVEFHASGIGRRRRGGGESRRRRELCGSAGRPAEEREIEKGEREREIEKGEDDMWGPQAGMWGPPPKPP